MKRYYPVFLLLFFSLVVTAQSQLTNLPTFYIHTNNEEPILSKEIYVKGKLTVESSDTTLAFSDSTEIRGRGNSTWTMPKKPYRIKLYNKKNLLNFPAKEKNWVLLANYADKTLLRNALAFEISRFVGLEYTPPVGFVDVVLNNEFLGNYMVTDQIEVNQFRVPVEKQALTDTIEPNLTGGYLIELDGFAYSEPVWFKTAKGMSATIKYPKDDEINAKQREYIANYTQKMENALFSVDFKDPMIGYRAYVDSATLINWYIACELTGNSDSFWSTYIYKKRNDPKFYFGPLWDYDIAFNNDYRLGDATQKLMREYAHEPKNWIKRFWEDPWFQKAVNDRWKTLVDAGIEQHLLDYLNQYQALLQQSQQLNYDRWPVLNQTVYREVFTFPTYDEGVDYLKSYIQSRVTFLNKGFVSGDVTPPVTTTFKPDVNAYYNIVNRRSGNAVDIAADGKKLMLWDVTAGKYAQHWKFEVDANGDFYIINRASGLAVKSIGIQGSQLELGELTNISPYKWEVLPTNVQNYFGVISRNSGFSFNNEGGSLENGTRLLEWPSNINKSDNARFTFIKVAETGLFNPQYATLDVYYNAFNQTVRLIDHSGLAPVVNVKVYAVNGAEVLSVNSFDTGSSLNVGELTNGVYVIRLMSADKMYSAKFIKR